MTNSAFLLVGVLAVPLLGAVAALLLRGRAGAVAATVASVLTLLLTVPMFTTRGLVKPAGRGPQLWHEADWSWVPALDLRLHLGVDGISYPLVVLTALLTVLCCGYLLWQRPERAGLLAALLLVIEVGILGTFLAFNLVLFFLAFEVVLLPMAAVIAGWGGPARRAAALKFALYTLAGSVLLLVGVVAVVVQTGTADLVSLTAAPTLSHTAQLWIFGLFALAFAVKSPLWPLHTWLPDAHTEAPTVGSVVLAGVLLKMGTYGLIRVGLGVTPEGAAAFAPALGVLAVAAILIGSLVCLTQTELKRLIAYSSVGHMGFVLLGIATLSEIGVQAALLGNIAHGLLTGLLFFLAGAIKDRAHTGLLADLGGLRERQPWLAGVLGFAALGSLGLPGLAGFWGEAFAVVAAVQRGGTLWTVLAVLAAIGGALTAAYLLRLLRRVSHGPQAAVLAGAPEARTPELAAWSPLVLLALLLGVAPMLVLELSASTVSALTTGAP
ncbi:complex I subunit 4 family protein [Catellatospora bangladeshensis]|uniref:NADH-quinone oxidoreductase subunit M n=1 Tax=Catellatospora bangladeshensis TaxID=310355 RepID=A0A8J3JEZ2_9ACTN|nr:NADH-quinone oxidoreductase subunit M [Catellatospora bangladeshensis]GIF79403.1 NADH-quinone oxidoreductase subunit M [Catellatospora bangladeshensis]